MDGFRFRPDWRFVHVGAAVTLAPLAIWSAAVLPLPATSEFAQVEPVSFIVNVGAYTPGTATANPYLSRPVETYGGGSAIFTVGRAALFANH